MSGQPVLHPRLEPHQISQQNELSAHLHRWETIPLVHYGNGRGIRCDRSVHFVGVSGEVLLSNALRETYRDLCDAESPAPLGNVSTKLSLRITVRLLCRCRHDDRTHINLHCSSQEPSLTLGRSLHDALQTGVSM